jgi:hypothetical protein
MEVVSVEDIVPFFEFLKVQITEQVFYPDVVWLLFKA